MEDIQKNLHSISEKIREYEKKYQRKPNSVKLLGATKGQSVEKMQAAINAGFKIFGENYLQEALEKIEHFKSNSTIEWHFIGPIQSNKIKKIAEHFSWVQSIDSKITAERFNNHRSSNLSPLNICIEVNISGEEKKSGVSPNDVLELAKYCQTLPNLRLRGLMAIPKRTNSFEKQRAECNELKSIFDKLCSENFILDTLSLGMSNDMEAAIAEGSTMVRIGTAIFGERI